LQTNSSFMLVIAQLGKADSSCSILLASAGLAASASGPVGRLGGCNIGKTVL
jgi:hypothetical protein